jgi:ATP sulfurylase
VDFDPLKPTVQMLGRWQPWHTGHTELFKRAHAKTGQVCIQIRQVPEQYDNPFNIDIIKINIIEALAKEGFTIAVDYIIMVLPNITDIAYGRKVGYTFTEHDLGEDIHNISATKIRKQMREEGTLADKS